MQQPARRRLALPQVVAGRRREHPGHLRRGPLGSARGRSLQTLQLRGDGSVHVRGCKKPQAAGAAVQAAYENLA